MVLPLQPIPIQELHLIKVARQVAIMVEHPRVFLQLEQPPLSILVWVLPLVQVALLARL